MRSFSVLLGVNLTHQTEVVMFPPDPHTLLTVGRPSVGSPDLALEDRLELVHPSVGEAQRLVVRWGQDRAGGNYLVIFTLEILQKLRPDSARCGLTLGQNSGTKVVSVSLDMLTVS